MTNEGMKGSDFRVSCARLACDLLIHADGSRLEGSLMNALFGGADPFKMTAHSTVDLRDHARGSASVAPY